MRLARDPGKTLRLKGREDRLGLRAAEQIAVVIAAAAAEPSALPVKGRAGDEHGVELLRREAAGPPQDQGQSQAGAGAASGGVSDPPSVKS